MRGDGRGVRRAGHRGGQRGLAPPCDHAGHRRGRLRADGRDRPPGRVADGARGPASDRRARRPRRRRGLGLRLLQRRRLKPRMHSKAGVEQLGRALRVELAPHGASASVAYFGFIDTAWCTGRLEPTRSPTNAREPSRSACSGACRRRRPATAIATGIERRAARIIAPKRWAALVGAARRHQSVLRMPAPNATPACRRRSARATRRSARGSSREPLRPLHSGPRARRPGSARRGSPRCARC